MADIVILGGGLTGISAAYHLEQKGFNHYKLFEKETTLGGLCGSITQDGFTFDYTGHLLHVNDPYFHTLIASLVGLDHFNVIHRRSFVFSHNTYTPYPYQINLSGLPTHIIADCIQGYVTRHQHIKKTRTFIDWVLKYFGTGFAKHFFMPYQRKIFAHDLNNITASWTGRFVPSTSLEEIIKGITQEHKTSVGYNAQFFYPKQGGIASWVHQFAQHIKTVPHLEHQVTSIDIKQKTVAFDNGHIEPYKILINTIPLDRLLKLVQGKSSRIFEAATSKLLCNSVLNFNLGFARSDVSDKHWIYFPEKSYPFYRLGFGHNFSQHMAPPGCSSLYGEIAYVDKSETWKKNIIRNALAKTSALLGLSQSDIITEKIIDISHAYVIYDHWREKNLDKLLHALQQEQIYSIGRYGAWKYSSMQEAVLDGKEIADRLEGTL